MDLDSRFPLGRSVAQCASAVFTAKGLLLGLIVLLLLVSSRGAFGQPFLPDQFTQVGRVVSVELKLNFSQSIPLPPGQWRVLSFRDWTISSFKGTPVKNLVLVNTQENRPLLAMVLSWTEDQPRAWSGADCDLPVNLEKPFGERFETTTSSLSRKCVFTDVLREDFRDYVVRLSASLNKNFVSDYVDLANMVDRLPRNVVASTGWFSQRKSHRIQWTIYANPEVSGFNSFNDISDLQVTDRQFELINWAGQLHVWQFSYMAAIEARFQPNLFSVKPTHLSFFSPSIRVERAQPLLLNAQGLPRLSSIGDFSRLDGLGLLTDSKDVGFLTIRSASGTGLSVTNANGEQKTWLSGLLEFDSDVTRDLPAIGVELDGFSPLAVGKSSTFEFLWGQKRWRHSLEVLKENSDFSTPLGPRRVFEIDHLVTRADQGGSAYRVLLIRDSILPIVWSRQVLPLKGPSPRLSSFTVLSLHATNQFDVAQVGILLSDKPEVQAAGGISTDIPRVSTMSAPSKLDTQTLSAVIPASLQPYLVPSAATTQPPVEPAPVTAPQSSSPVTSPPVALANTTNLSIGSPQPAAGPVLITAENEIKSSAVARPRLVAHALVVGNAAYPRNARLDNPVNDARAIARKLESFGFKVSLVEDARRDRMLKALLDFKRSAAASDLSLLFYAGHGAQIDGSNYMLPIDVVSDEAEEVKIQGLNVAQVVDGFLPGKTRLVLLDACRNNPFLRVGTRGATLGLAPMNVASGTLIAYATKDGSTAEDGTGSRHSPFTAALLQHLDEPNDIGLVLRRVRGTVMRATAGKQQPWEYGSLVGDELVLSNLAR